MSFLDIHIPSYLLFQQDRGEHKSGGGLLVYIKDIYKASTVNHLSSVSEMDFHQLWIKVQCKKLKSFLLCTVYRPPSTPMSFLEDLRKSIVDASLLGLNIIITGDLNMNILGNCPDNRALADFCATFNRTQLVKEPTRITESSQTLIGIAFTTNVNIIDTCEIKSSTISYHSLVSLTLKLKAPKTTLFTCYY